MRERYLDAFDRVWIDCLNGDKYKTGKVTPDGQPDPSVFSTEFNREGIQVGTAVALMVAAITRGARSLCVSAISGEKQSEPTYLRQPKMMVSLSTTRFIRHWSWAFRLS